MTQPFEYGAHTLPVEPPNTTIYFKYDRLEHVVQILFILPQ